MWGVKNVSNEMVILGLDRCWYWQGTFFLQKSINDTTVV